MMKIFLTFLLALFIAATAYDGKETKVYEDQTYVVLKTENSLYIMRKWEISWFVFPFSAEVISFKREPAKDTDQSGAHLVINDRPVYFSEFKQLLYYPDSTKVIQGRRIREFELKVTNGVDGAKRRGLSLRVTSQLYGTAICLST